MPRQASAVSEVPFDGSPSSSPSVNQSQPNVEAPLPSLETPQVQVQIEHSADGRGNESPDTQNLEHVPSSSHHFHSQEFQPTEDALEMTADPDSPPTSVDDSHLDQGMMGYTSSYTYTQRIPASRTGLIRPTMSLTSEAPTNTTEKAQPGIITTCVFGLIGILGVTLFFIRRWRRNRTRRRGEIVVQNLNRAKRQQAHIRDSEFENLKIDPVFLEQGDAYNDLQDDPFSIVPDELQTPAKAHRISLRKSKEDFKSRAQSEDNQRHSFSTVKAVYTYTPARPSPLRF